MEINALDNIKYFTQYPITRWHTMSSSANRLLYLVQSIAYYILPTPCEVKTLTATIGRKRLVIKWLNYRWNQWV